MTTAADISAAARGVGLEGQGVGIKRDGSTQVERSNAPPAMLPPPADGAPSPAAGGMVIDSGGDTTAGHVDVTLPTSSAGRQAALVSTHGLVNEPLPLQDGADEDSPEGPDDTLLTTP